MIELKSDVFIDKRVNKTIFRLTMHKDGKVYSTQVEYEKLLNKLSAESEFNIMILDLCNHLY